MKNQITNWMFKIRTRCPLQMIRDYSVKSETGLLISSGVFPNTSFKSFCSVESSKDDKTERHDYYDPIVTKLAHEIRSSVRSYSEQQSQAGRAKIQLVGIMDPLKKQGRGIETDAETDAQSYSDCIAKACEEDGIEYSLWKLAPESSLPFEKLKHQSKKRQVKEAIQRANSLPNVHGVLVYYPIFKDALQTRKEQLLERRIKNKQSKIMLDLNKYKNQSTGVFYRTLDDYFRDMVYFQKDVEGLCDEYSSMFRDANYLYSQNSCNLLEDTSNKNIIFPCTALSVVKILERCLGENKRYDNSKPLGKRLEGTVATIINRSEILGRPLAAMLANDGAKVYSVDIDSIVIYTSQNGQMKHRDAGKNITLQECVRESSVLVTGVPSGTFQVPSEWVQPYTTVVNVAAEPNIQESDMNAIEGINFIPRVGQVTVAILEYNLMRLHQRYHNTG